MDWYWWKPHRATFVRHPGREKSIRTFSSDCSFCSEVQVAKLLRKINTNTAKLPVREMATRCLRSQVYLLMHRSFTCHAKAFLVRNGSPVATLSAGVDYTCHGRLLGNGPTCPLRAPEKEAGDNTCFRQLHLCRSANNTAMIHTYKAPPGSKPGGLLASRG